METSSDKLALKSTLAMYKLKGQSNCNILHKTDINIIIYFPLVIFSYFLSPNNPIYFFDVFYSKVSFIFTLCRFPSYATPYFKPKKV